MGAPGVPIKYRKAPENVIASYDFLDIATGTGYKNFYCGDVAGGNIITTNELYSRSGVIGSIDTSLTYELDFDLSFSNTLVFEGQALVNVPIVIWNRGAAGSKSVVVSGALIHVDEDDVETTIGSVVADTITRSISTGPTGEWDVYSALITMPKTTFKNGEKLRFNIVAAPKTGSSDTGVFVAFDPKNRSTFPDYLDTTWTSSQSVLTLPVEANL